MSEWKEYLLEDVIEKFIDYRGKTPQKTSFGIPLMTAKIVKGGRLLKPTEFIAKEDYSTWMTRGFPEINDILLTTEAPLGEVALLKDKNVALGQRIITLQTKKKLCDSIFLKYYLQSFEGQATLQSRASGSTVEGIKSAALKKIEISLPPITEQKSIASILYSLDNKIDLLHRQNATFEKIAETLFRQWFVEEAEEDWEMGRISDLIDFNPNRKLVKRTMSPFLEMSELSTTTYSPSGWYSREFSSGSKFKNGDTLLARITPCLENGKTAYVDFLENEQIGWGSTEFIVMRPKNNLHTFFAYTIARNQDFKDFAESCMQGSSGRQRVDIENLKSYEIAIPPEDVIKNFNNFSSSIIPKLKSNQTQIRTLTALRDTLLPKLMSGEFKINL